MLFSRFCTIGQDILESCTIGQELLETMQIRALVLNEGSELQRSFWTKYALLVGQNILEITF